MSLPLSVKGGASEIDGALAVLAAFSLLVHFGVVGAFYSDWMDSVVSEDLTATLVGPEVGDLRPPPVEASEPVFSATSIDQAGPPAPRSQKPPKAQAVTHAASDERGAPDLLKAARNTEIEILRSLTGGPNVSRTLAHDSGAPVDLNEIATKFGAVTTRGSLIAGMDPGGPIQPGRESNLGDLRGADTSPLLSAAGAPIRVVPAVAVGSLAPLVRGSVPDAEVTIRKMIEPGARRCYKKGLEIDPSQSGKLVLVIEVAESGEVDSAYVANRSGLSVGVATCIASIARGVRFERACATGARGATRSTIIVPFNFLRQGY